MNISNLLYFEFVIFLLSKNYTKVSTIIFKANNKGRYKSTKKCGDNF